MFNKDYNFKGIHANIVTQLTSEIDSETKFKIFDRNIDVFIIAPIVGYLYGTKDVKDETGQVTVDNVKKINFDQMNREAYTLQYNYSLIMLLHDKQNTTIEERLNRAFRYADGTPEREECDKIFESYVLGGIKVLKTKLLDDATTIDDYINNIYKFLADYSERHDQNFKEEDILDLCTNN